MEIEKFANDLIKKQNKEIDQRLEANETLTKDLDRKLSTKIMELTRQLEGLKAEQSTDTLVDELNEAKSDIAQLTEVIKNITKDNKMATITRTYKRSHPFTSPMSLYANQKNKTLLSTSHSQLC